ncbi:MAG: hypothetical protein IT445_09660 [Phycisphaeraceae bacterium]|nr:hypothetical protein [Phycisphaeraceae bacterium]
MVATSSSSQWRWGALELLVVMVLVATALACYRNSTIHPDEAFHLLAARSINAGQGLPNLGGQHYDRAWIFSYAVAYSTHWFGDSLEAARLPSLVSTMLLVMAVWLFVRLTAGRLAAILAALLLGMSIFTLDISHFCRFYSPHALVIFVIAAATYRAFSRQTRWLERIAWLLLAAGASMLAFHLQSITVVTLVALGVWVLLQALVWLLLHPDMHHRLKLTWLAAAVGALGLGVAVLTLGGWWQWAWSRFAWAPNWMDSETASVLFYHRLLLQWYPILWAMFPAALLAAVAVYRRPAIFMACIFCLGLLLMSIGAAHAPRYIYFLMPMFFILWGMAIAAAVSAVYARLMELVAADQKSARRAWSLGCTAAIVAALLFTAHFIPAYASTERVMRMAGPNAPFRGGDFVTALAAARDLQPDLLDIQTVLAAPAAKAQYYLPGRRIVLLGRPDNIVIQKDYVPDADTLRQLITTEQRGLIVVEREYWRDPRFVNDALADVIESLTRSLPVPAKTHIRVFCWSHEANSNDEISMTN